MSRITSTLNSIIRTICSINPRAPKYFALGAVVLVVLIAYWPFQVVPTGSRGVITQFGAIQSIQGEGAVFLSPWQKMALFSVRAESVKVDGAEGSTSDQQPVHVGLTVRYKITPSRVADVYEQYSHNGDLSQFIETATQEVFKATTAKFAAPDLINQRAKVSSDITAALKAKVALYGAEVINIDMRSFSFSKDYMDAISAKVTQEQLRLGAENKLKTVEAEQKQKVAVAEAEASAKRAEADGQAYADLKVATAQAEALKIQSQSLSQSKEVLELRRIEVEMEKAKRWDGKLPQSMYGGAPIPFLNMGGK